MASENPVARYSAEYQARHYAAEGDRALREVPRNVGVPAAIERRETSAPCFRCAARGRCRHRPWVNEG